MQYGSRPAGAPTAVDGCRDCIPFPEPEGNCQSNPCFHGGSCVNKPYQVIIDGRRYRNTFQCNCDPGHTGRQCEIAQEADECASNPCQHNGVCHDLKDSYACTCQRGFGGADCSSTPSPCDVSPAPCGDYANVCHDWTRFMSILGYDFSCRCADGYESRSPQLMMMGYPNGYADCQSDIDECLSRPCMNRGRCYDSRVTQSLAKPVPPGKYECSCSFGYSGTNCDQEDISLDTRPPRSGPLSNQHNPLWGSNGVADGRSCQEWFGEQTFATSLTEACCENAKDCETGVPEVCTEACAALWEPYYKVCQGYMEIEFPASLNKMRPQAGGGMSIYSDFSELCKAKQYGDVYRCNIQFEQQGENQMVRACRASQGRNGVTFPNTCPFACLQPFLEFYDSCRDKSVDYGYNLAGLDAFHDVRAQATIPATT